MNHWYAAAFLASFVFIVWISDSKFGLARWARVKTQPVITRRPEMIGIYLAATILVFGVGVPLAIHLASSRGAKCE